MNGSQARNYARIEAGMVVELFATAEDIASVFHPELTWVDVTDQKSVAVGWLFDGRAFAPPRTPDTPPPQPRTPTIVELQTLLQSLAAQVAALGGTS